MGAGMPSNRLDSGVGVQNDGENNFEPTLDFIADRILTGAFKDIVVLTGAGISVSAGIPDFRSEGTGLYSQVRQLLIKVCQRFACILKSVIYILICLSLRAEGLESPEAVFSISYFRHNPRPFYVLAQKLFPGNYYPSVTHFFVVLLWKRGLLRRQYTQNIDNLERLAGIPSGLLVEAHGSFADVHCITCRKQYSPSWFKQNILKSDGNFSTCDNIIPRELKEDFRNRLRQEILSSSSSNPSDEETRQKDLTQRKEEPVKTTCPSPRIFSAYSDSSSESKGVSSSKPDESENDSVICGGLIKPDIVFFGEQLPSRFAELAVSDMGKADLILILGTSLLVYPFASLPSMASSKCFRVLINRDPVGKSSVGCNRLLYDEPGNYRDIFYQGDCDEGIEKLAKLLGWWDELVRLRNEYIETQELSDDACYRALAVLQLRDVSKDS